MKTFFPAGLLALFLPAVPGGILAADSCSQGAEALKRQELGLAESLLKQCLKSRPHEIFSYLQLCGLYQLQNNNEALSGIARAGLKRFPQEKRFYFTVGNHAGREKRFSQAIEVFSNGLRRWPDDPSLRKSLADSHAGLGMELLDKGNNEQAEKHLRQATELADDDVEARLNLGRALHNLNRSVEALAEFNRVLSLAPQLPLVQFHRGMVLHSLGEYDAAIEALGQEIERNPDHPPSYLFRGLSLIAQGECQKALRDLEVSAQRMPDNAKAQFSRARCLYRLGKLSEAESGLRKTLELDPTDPAPVNMLARLLAESGRKDEAEQMFQKGTQLSRKLRSAAPGEIRFEAPPSRKN